MLLSHSISEEKEPFQAEKAPHFHRRNIKKCLFDGQHKRTSESTEQRKLLRSVHQSKTQNNSICVCEYKFPWDIFCKFFADFPQSFHHNSKSSGFLFSVLSCIVSCTIAFKVVSQKFLDRGTQRFVS